MKVYKATNKKNSEEGKETYRAGSHLFLKGNPGGDLYFIEQGIVEIYTRDGGDEVVLTEMAAGEVIGVMTCLTSSPRMASARVKEDVVCRKIPHDYIRNTLQSLPAWIRIILKEFQVRLGNMNTMYSESKVQSQKLEENQITFLYSATQVAAAFLQIQDAAGDEVDGEKWLAIDPSMKMIANIIGQSAGEVDRLFSIFTNSGLIAVEAHPVTRVRSIAQSRSQGLMYFVQLVRKKKAEVRRLINAQFTSKDNRNLLTLFKVVRHLGMDETRECRFNRKELANTTRNMQGSEINEESLLKAQDYKMVKLTDDEIIFVPDKFARKVSSIECLRRLNVMEQAKQMVNSAA